MSLPVPFARWTTYPGHSGIDFPYAAGTAFRASGPGTVRNLGKNSRGGYYIWVKYDGYPAVGYHHMNSHAGCPSPGTRVSEGTQLGYVGWLGLNSTGAHLHSEVEGRATAAGYWTVFDKNRVVGATPGGGGSGAGGGATPEEPAGPNYNILEDEMIRIQAPSRGIAMIGAGYFRPLANNQEVAASSLIMSRHIDCSDADFDRFVTIAISGTPAGNLPSIVRTAARPLRLYRYDKKLLAMGDGGKVWEVPNEDYRILMDALGLAGPDVLRDISKNELDFMQMVLSSVNPDPVAQGQVEAILKLSDEDAKRIAANVQVPSAAEIAKTVNDDHAKRMSS